MADCAPVLDAYSVRHAAILDMLIRHLVIGDLDAAREQPAAVADDAVLPADYLAVLVERRPHSTDAASPARV